MNAFPITIKEISSTIQQAYSAGKAGILRWGHIFKTEYAPMIADKLSACALAAFAFLKSLLQSDPATNFIFAGGLLFLAVLSFQIADSKDYENSVWTKSAWKTAGLVAFIASTVMTNMGIIAYL